MKRSTAITLVLLGGGAVAMAVASSKRCTDPVTGQPIACSSSGGSHGGASGRGTSSSSSSDSAGSSSVSRGGFGASGAHAGSGS